MIFSISFVFMSLMVCEAAVIESGGSCDPELPPLMLAQSRNYAKEYADAANQYADAAKSEARCFVDLCESIKALVALCPLTDALLFKVPCILKDLEASSKVSVFQEKIAQKAISFLGPSMKQMTFDEKQEILPSLVQWYCWAEQGGGLFLFYRHALFLTLEKPIAGVSNVKSLVRTQSVLQSLWKYPLDPQLRQHTSVWLHILRKALAYDYVMQNFEMVPSAQPVLRGSMVVRSSNPVMPRKDMGSSTPAKFITTEV